MYLRSGLFAVAFLPLSLHAQQQQQPPYVAKIDVSLVNVDVTVIGRGGPVRGLTRDDFEVREDGVPQTITNFYAVDSAAPASPSKAQEASGSPSTDERFRRRVLVLIDQAHTSRHDRDVALTQLEKFIDDHFNSGEYDWSIAVSTRHVRLVLPPTSDKAAIHAAVDEVRQLSARGLMFDRDLSLAARARSADRETSAAATAAASDSPLESSTERAARAVFEANGQMWQDNFDTRDSVDAVVQALRAFTNAPGRKIVLLISGGLGTTGEFTLIPFDVLTTPSEQDRVFAADRVVRMADSGAYGTRLRDALVREANASNVAFYVINPQGLHPLGDMTGAPMTNNSMSFWIAGETGGRMLPGNNVTASLQEFDRASGTFYSLAYRPAHDEDGKYHRIEVRLARPGSYRLQYRTGYASTSADAQLVRALASPLTVAFQPSTLPITVTTGVPRNDRGVITVPLLIDVPAAGWYANPEFYVSVFDAAGNHITTQRFANAVKSGDLLRATRDVQIAAGQPHRIVVAVRDPLTDAVGITQLVR